jgi:hypothetical protein
VSAFLTQLVNSFQSFFSRGFWFGNFLPVAIFMVVNLIIAATAFPEAVQFWAWLRQPGASEVVSYAPLVVGGLVVVAYALAPMIPTCQAILDGRLLPAWLHDGIRRRRLPELRRIRERLNAAVKTYADYELLGGTAIRQAWAARSLGMTRQPPIGGRTEIVAAETALTAFRRAMESRGRLPAIADAEAAVQAVVSALSLSNAGLPANHPNAEELSWSRRAANAMALLLQLLEQAPAEARHRFQFLSEHTRGLAVREFEDPQATRIGDARVVAERYSEDVYQAEFEYLWPRLQLVVPANDPVAERIGAARAQVEFAVLSLLLMLSVPVVWLPLLALTTRTPWLLLGIGAAAPMFAGFFYQLVFVSQVALGEVVKVAIDRYRLDVIKMLHQPRPATLSGERELWRQLGAAGRRGIVSDLIYQYPP